MKKVLNLYAGIGGNRKLWEGVEVTAIELDPEIAKIYQDFFPNDEVIVTDAHQFLLDHIKDEWDFIWSSPPCQSHSQIRYNLGYLQRGTKPIYPDMALYQEILLLTHYSKAKWCIENTISFYEPLIKPQNAMNHWFWSNFIISPIDGGDRGHHCGTVETLQTKKEINIDKYDITNKRQILRNCMEPNVSQHIFDCAFKFQQQKIMEATQ